MNGRRSLAAYRRLTALYPKRFRDEYRDDLLAAFRQQLLDDGARRTWRSTIPDLVRTVPSQHLEAHMKRPRPQTVMILALCVLVAAMVLAIVAGTGPVVGVFLAAAVAALVVATLAWRAGRPDRSDLRSTRRWRTILSTGIALLAAVIVAINVPPYDDQELPGPAWAVMMLGLISGVALIAVGSTLGLAGRSSPRAPTD